MLAPFNPFHRPARHPGWTGRAPRACFSSIHGLHARGRWRGYRPLARLQKGHLQQKEYAMRMWQQFDMISLLDTLASLLLAFVLGKIGRAHV